MKKIEVVAFDCDGVMFDSTKANRAYYNDILSHFNAPDLTEKQFSFCHMHTADESIAYIFKDKNEFEQAQTYRKSLSYQQFISYMKIEPHLISLLKKLRLNYHTAVATNRTDTMESVLEEHNLENLFDLVICALDVKFPKPHPEPLNKVLNHFKIKPDQMIYIGDSELDQIASKAAGIPFIACNNHALKALHHITSLKELETILGL